MSQALEFTPFCLDPSTNQEAVVFGFTGEHTPHNQDAYFHRSDPPLVLVCDGVTSFGGEKEQETGGACARNVARNFPSIFDACLSKIIALEDKEELEKLIDKYLIDKLSAYSYLKKLGLATVMSSGKEFLLSEEDYQNYLKLDKGQYEFIQKNKQNTSGLCREDGSLDLAKLTQVWQEDKQNNPEYYSDLIKVDRVELAILEAIFYTNIGLSLLRKDYPNLSGATTLTGFLVHEDSLYIFSVGDSRTVVIDPNGEVVAATVEYRDDSYLRDFLSFEKDGLPEFPRVDICKVNLADHQNGNQKMNKIQEWINTIFDKNLKILAKKALEKAADPEDDRTLLVKKVVVSGKTFTVVSFTDGVFYI